MPAAIADDAVRAAIDELGSLGRVDVPIGALTTYRVGGTAAVFVEPRSLEDLATVRRAAHVSGLALIVLGRGSNMLVADRGVEAIVVATSGLGGTIEIDRSKAQVVADSAVLMPVLARKTAALGLAGFEWAVGVPGSLGGGVRMNAGGHGSDIASSLVEVRIADLASTSGHDDLVRWCAADELMLGFRSSAIRDTQIVLAARLQLRNGDRIAAEREIADVVRWRRSHQPGGQNAGSVFVNPVPGAVSAGALIDQIGLRGFRVGSACVSDKHANFVQADVDGSADDVVELMRIVGDRVAESTGYRLRSEIRLVGFGHDPLGIGVVAEGGGDL